MITPQEVSQATGSPLGNVQLYWPLIQKALIKRGCTSRTMLAVAAATVSTEVGSFKPITEYGDHAYFRRYDNRADLGNNQLDDGYTYRGRGFVQLTGRANYRKYGHLLGTDLERFPDRALDPDVAASILAAYFQTHGMDVWCNRYDVAKGAEREKVLQKLRRLVNGGLNGYERFKGYVEKLLKTPKAAGTTKDTDNGKPKSGAAQPSEEAKPASSDLPSVSGVSGVRKGAKPALSNKGKLRRG